MTESEMNFFTANLPVREGGLSDNEHYNVDPLSNLTGHLKFAISKWLNTELSDFSRENFSLYMRGALNRSFILRENVQKWLDLVKPFPEICKQMGWMEVFNIADEFGYEVEA